MENVIDERKQAAQKQRPVIGNNIYLNIFNAYGFQPPLSASASGKQIISQPPKVVGKKVENQIEVQVSDSSIADKGMIMYIIF